MHVKELDIALPPPAIFYDMNLGAGAWALGEDALGSLMARHVRRPLIVIALPRERRRETL